jgi:hypothetical protein
MSSASFGNRSSHDQQTSSSQGVAQTARGSRRQAAPVRARMPLTSSHRWLTTWRRDRKEGKRRREGRRRRVQVGTVMRRPRHQG